MEADKKSAPRFPPGKSAGGALCPIDFHCHGVGKFDFSEPPEVSLDAVEKHLAAAKVRAVITLYVPHRHFESFLDLLVSFEAGRRGKLYRYILGLAIEGPLLASHGGTPENGVWCPTMEEWTRIAGAGPTALRYVVMSPDTPLGHGRFATPGHPPNVEWITDCLLDGGVLPALGHFAKADANSSARAVERVLACVERRGAGPIVTDHLYNDMPLNFPHAWRGAQSRLMRNVELAELDLPSWDVHRAEQILGPVPASILRGAQRGSIKACLNFDGEHVDLSISKRTVELFGAGCFMLMTDRIESRILSGQKLLIRDDCSLLYQENGVVAGGSQSVRQQIQNMRLAGFAEQDIRDIAVRVPARVLQVEEFVDEGIAESALTTFS